MKYQHIVVHQYGGPETMLIEEDELPAPAAGQARVKILAADVSFSDVNVRRGRYPGAPRPPLTPGYAMVGEIDQLGPQTAGVAPGQRVAALTFTGSYSQYICLPATLLVPAPQDVDPAEAVCLVLNYVAAYQMLHRVARVAAGQRILVHGAAGGVGSALLELSKLASLETYGTASKPKHDLVTRLGATPIDYRNEDFVARVLALTAGSGVDAAFDPMGAEHLKSTAKTVRPGGTIVGYGFYTTANRGGAAVLDVLRQYLLLARWSLPPHAKHGAFYDERPLMNKHPDWFRADLTHLFDLLATGALHPVIAARLPLAAAPRAHQMIEAAEVQGKLVLMPNDAASGHE